MKMPIDSTDLQPCLDKCWVMHQATFFIANHWLGPYLATGHFLKDGGFSSIPSTYDQHTKPFAYSTDIFG